MSPARRSLRCRLEGSRRYIWSMDGRTYFRTSTILQRWSSTRTKIFSKSTLVTTISRVACFRTPSHSASRHFPQGVLHSVSTTPVILGDNSVFKRVLGGFISNTNPSKRSICIGYCVVVRMTSARGRDLKEYPAFATSDEECSQMKSLQRWTVSRNSLQLQDELIYQRSINNIFTRYNYD